jgi:hypothetical protein
VAQLLEFSFELFDRTGLELCVVIEKTHTTPLYNVKYVHDLKVWS